MKKLLALVLTIALCVTMFSVTNKAESKEIPVEMNGFQFTLYDDGGQIGSVWLTGYTGSETTLRLPTHIIYEGKQIPIQEIKEEAFAGNTNLQKVIIPDGYMYIGPRAFAGCSGITEMVITGTIEYSPESSLTDIPNCKTYKFGAAGQGGADWLKIAHIAEGDTYGPISGVTAYVIQGDPVDDALQMVNTDRPNTPIILNYGDSDPGKEARYTRVLPEDEPETTVPTTTVPTTTVPTTTKAGGGSTEPSNPYEKGASYDRADKAVTNYSSENDVPGSVYGLLQLKQKKATKTSIKVGWKSVPGAAKYAYYATNCGPKNKYVKHGITTGTSFNYKKICGKNLKKGSYYKFIVIAIDAKNKVVSTSKTVHVATKGGKVTNDKKVKTKVKKNKKTIKVNKTFKIKAKEVKPKKGKVKRHRKIKYESLNPKVASVNGKGAVKGASKGTTYVFAYAQNGVSAKVKVTVK